MADMDTRFVRACLDVVARTLDDEEVVMLIDKGQTRYGRQTYLYYRVRIATLVARTGNSPINPRAVCVAVNVDTPDSAALVPLSEWLPFP